MRRKIIDSLYCGDLSDCSTAGADWFVVHSAKHPCFHEKCGQPKPTDANYLTHEEGRHLYLNIIDAPTPMFRMELFVRFLAFMEKAWATGKPILIHCNKGESRSPTLALLFLAKRLYRLNPSSFDDAWDDFQKLLGDTKYQPSAGIEQWMREHWSEIPTSVPLPQLATEATASAPVPDRLELPSDPATMLGLVRERPLVHFAAFTQIEKKNHTWETPTPNKLQFDIDEVYDWCMDQKLKCRMIVLKPRQVGCSTKVGHTCYHHMRRHKSDMLMMSDVAKRTEKIWEIFNDYSDKDTFQWDSFYTYNTEKGRFTYADGSEGLVEHDTALDAKAGISGTRQVLWMSEAARYMKTGGRDMKVITAVLNSLADVPKSLAVLESTADGAAGFFYETWQRAVTLEQRKQGAQGNGWIKIFAAWHEFSEHALDRKSENEEWFKEGLDDRERRGIALYGWTANQIAWRRNKIAETGDPKLFDQDFPEDEQLAFLASGRPRFDIGALTKMELYAKHLDNIGKAERLSLERGSNGEINAQPNGDGGDWLWCIERPTSGGYYIAFIDPCTGEQSEGSRYADAHAAGIWRAGHHDERGTWHNHKLVAAIDVPTGCRWDAELISDKLHRLAKWYGDCMIAPEWNQGLGVINGLKRFGAILYEREKNNTMYPGPTLKVVGWETNKDTRPALVDNLASAIREGQIDVAYLPMISELKTFIVNDRGRAEAKANCHDDWVTGPAIGLYLISRATLYLPMGRWQRDQEQPSELGYCAMT